MNKTQRKYFLRQQMGPSARNWARTTRPEAEASEYRRKIAEAKMPDEAEKEAQRELKRMENMPSQAAEYSVIKTYLDWLVELPWNN